MVWWSALPGAVALLALLALVSIFIGYPITVALLARVRPKPYPQGAEHTMGMVPGELPRVAVIMSAFNEAARLPDKIQTLQGLDYPSERLRFYVSDDASSDDTWPVLQRLARDEPRLKLRRNSHNTGKPTNLNRLVEMVDADGGTDLLVFCDARQPLAPRSIRALVAPLLDPRVGGATGDLVLPPEPDGSLRGMGLYWRYETLLRRSEAAVGSVVGATGALYVVRREAFVPFEAELVLDAMLLPLRVALDGRRFVFASGALAFDVYSDDLGHEFRRKARTLGGLYQAMAFEPRLLRPGTAVFWAFLFHKVGRLAFPWLMGLMLAGSLGAVALTPWWTLVWWAWVALVVAQLGFYVGALLPLPGPLGVLRTLGALMAASWLGWWRWKRGSMRAAWKAGEDRQRQ